MRHTMQAFFRHAARAALSLCLVAFAATCALAQEPAQEMLVQARAELRKERSDTSPVVAVLAPGEKVLAGLPKAGWLAVFRQGAQTQDEASAAGFLPAGLLKPAPKAQPVSSTPAVPAAPTGPSQKPRTQQQAQQSAQPGSTKDAGQGQMLNKQEPVRVTSDKLTYKQAENAVVFEGNVHATHGDMALWSNKVTAYFAEKKKAPAGKDGGKDGGKEGGDFSDKIERIVAEGNVRMVSGKNEGFCGKLTYYVAESVLRMDDNPILREGTNTVRGEVIKYYQKENRSEVLSGTQRRVEAIFQSGGNMPGGK